MTYHADPLPSTAPASWSRILPGWALETVTTAAAIRTLAPTTRRLALSYDDGDTCCNCRGSLPEHHAHFPILAGDIIAGACCARSCAQAMADRAAERAAKAEQVPA